MGESNVWSKDAAILLKQFLETPVGQQFLRALRAGRPSLPLGAVSTEAAALRGAEAAGYEACLRVIEESLADVQGWERWENSETAGAAEESL